MMSAMSFDSANMSHAGPAFRDQRCVIWYDLVGEECQSKKIWWSKTFWQWSLQHSMILNSNSNAFVQYTSLPASFKMKLFSYKIRDMLFDMIGAMSFHMIGAVSFDSPNMISDMSFDTANMPYAGPAFSTVAKDETGPTFCETFHFRLLSRRAALWTAVEKQRECQKP